MTYSIKINNVDRTNSIIDKTVTINDETRDSPSLLRCQFFNHDNLGIPALDQTITVTKDGVDLFDGTIIEATYNRLGDGENILSLVATDYTRELDRNLVVENYQDMTDKEIIEDIVARYCQGSGITTANVIENSTVKNIIFNYVSPSQCFKKICSLTGNSWYIDYDKDIHYFPLTTTSAPFDIDDANADYKDLKITKDNTDIRNRVYVRGGTYLSDFTTISMVADGEQTVFNLPEKPHEITMKQGGVTKTIGIKNISSPGDFDYLLNYQEKYIEISSGVPPAAGTVMEFTFKYNVPVLVAVENTASINAVGQFEYAIFDTNIKNQDDARARAQAELTDYASTVIDGSFITYVDGFRAGQYIHINLTGFDVDDDYLVQKVQAKSLGGGTYVYTVSIANTKKLGILNFLIRMLELQRNQVAVDIDEVVDELFTPTTQAILITDSLVSDSLIAPPFKWGSCKWGLAQWS